MKLTITERNSMEYPPIVLITLDQRLVLEFTQGHYELLSPCCQDRIVTGEDPVCRKCERSIDAPTQPLGCFVPTDKPERYADLQLLLHTWIRKLDMADILEAEVYSRTAVEHIREFDPRSYQIIMFSEPAEARQNYCRRFTDLVL